MLREKKEKTSKSSVRGSHCRPVFERFVGSERPIPENVRLEESEEERRRQRRTEGGERKETRRYAQK